MVTKTSLVGSEPTIGTKNGISIGRNIIQIAGMCLCLSYAYSI